MTEVIYSLLGTIFNICLVKGCTGFPALYSQKRFTSSSFVIQLDKYEENRWKLGNSLFASGRRHQFAKCKVIQLYFQEE